MANTTICLYGATDTAKTTNIAFLAKYLYEKTHKPLRLISADTGGGWRSIQKYIDAGIIEPLSLRNEPGLVFMLHKLVQGWWPLDIKDGIRQSGKMFQDLSNTSGYAFEGLTSISDLIMSHVSGRKLGQDSAYKMIADARGNETITSGNVSDSTSFSKEQITDSKGLPLSTETIGTAAMAHYGFVQDKVPLLMEKSWDLPVELVIWTAHEAQGEDAISNTITRGPALVGKKGTAKIGRKVGMLIHAERVGDIKSLAGSIGTNKEIESAPIRYYFMTHPDRTNPRMTWPAKPRVDSEVIPDLLKEFPGGFFSPTTKPGTGIDRYLEVEAKLLAKGVDELMKWKLEVEKMEVK